MTSLRDDPNYRAAYDVVESLPFFRPWTIESLVAKVSLSRGRPIALRRLPDDLAKHCSAAWFPKPHADYVYIRDQLTDVQREISISHELGHILLAHTLTDDERADYLKEIFPRVPREVLTLHVASMQCSPLARCNYEHPFEQQAEWFARLLISKADQYRDVLVPDHATPTQRRMLVQASQVFGWQ